VNILLIISEDNGQHLGCYGDLNVATPNIDRLASEGVRFENAYTTQAVCSPGRASIYTGLYPHQCGQIGLATHNYAQYEAFPNLFSLLKGAGYRTGLIGKLHVNPESDFPIDMWWNDKDYISFQNRDVHRMAEEADAFLNASSDPFLLTVAYPDAHLPLLRQQCGIPETPYEADDVSVLPQVGIDSQRLREHSADYYNCMSRLDTAVGLLLERLEQSGKADDTLVIFTTDHGAQFSRGKTCCYEGGIKIPHIVRWPGHTASGETRTELISHVDILPTITDILGFETPPGAGRSYRQLLLGEEVVWRDYVCAEWISANPPCYFPQRSIRNDRYKLVVNYLSDRPSPSAEGYSGPDRLWPPGATEEEIAASDDRIKAAYATYLNPPSEELYDLANDPWEFDNKADDPNLASIRDDLRAQLARWQSETDDRVVDQAVLTRQTEENDRISAGFYGESAWGSSRDYEWHYSEYLHG
jgi:N-sulfoglucosamine sulfohydrolase